MYVYCVNILQYQNVQNNWQTLLKWPEISMVLIIFKGVLCHVCTIFLLFLTVYSLSIRYHWDYYLYTRQLQQKFILKSLMHRIGNDCRINTIILNIMYSVNLYIQTAYLTLEHFHLFLLHNCHSSIKPSASHTNTVQDWLDISLTYCVIGLNFPTKCNCNNIVDFELVRLLYWNSLPN